MGYELGVKSEEGEEEEKRRPCKPKQHGTRSHTAVSHNKETLNATLPVPEVQCATNGFAFAPNANQFSLARKNAGIAKKAAKNSPKERNRLFFFTCRRRLGS